MWVRINNIWDLKPGDAVKAHNGYETFVDVVDEFDLEMGSIPNGLHNERASLTSPSFDFWPMRWVNDRGEKAEVEYELTNFDLIQEIEQLGGFQAKARSREVNVDDFNHCMLDHEVDRFKADVQAAIDQFVDAVHKRMKEVWEELDKRGVIEHVEIN
jgi:hypothetical protein